ESRGRNRHRGDTYLPGRAPRRTGRLRDHIATRAACHCPWTQDPRMSRPSPNDVALTVTVTEALGIVRIMTVRRYPFSALRFGSRNASRSVGVSTVVTGAPPVESNPVRLQRVERLPHPRLRSSVRGGYAAYVTTRHAGLILPATTSVL